MQRCSKCGQSLPLEEFYRAASGRNGRRADCKDCVRAGRRMRRHERDVAPPAVSGVAVVSPIFSVVRAAESGERRELLVALRVRLFNAIQHEQTLPRDLPGLSRELSRIVAEIEEIDAAEHVTSPPPLAPDELFDLSQI